MGAVSRRRFLRITGAAVGTAAAGSAGFQAACSRAPSAARTPGTGIRKVPTFCDICFWKCGAIAYVRDGRLWKIRAQILLM
jgi:thiosulfate reductase/polysulfide reductase chain A